MGDVLVPEPIDSAGVDFLHARGHRVHQLQTPTDPAFSRLLPWCEALIARQISVDDALLEEAKQRKIVARYGAGFEKIDLSSATRRAIWVTTCPGANAQSVAGHALGMMGRRYPSHRGPPLTKEADTRVAKMTAVDVDHVLRGRAPPYPLNLGVSR